MATDRFRGVLTSQAIKVPARRATAVNQVLSGDPGTIDGYTFTDGERLLLTGQTDPIENGIWEVNLTSDWQRAPDFDGARDSTTSTLVVAERSVGNPVMWILTNTDPVDIGTDAITFQQYFDPDAPAAANLQQVTDVGNTTDNTIIVSPVSANTTAVQVTNSCRIVLENTAGDGNINIGTPATDTGQISVNGVLNRWQFTGVSTEFRILGGAVFRMEERNTYAPVPDTAGYGNLWIRDDVPNVLVFRNDAGEELSLGSASIVTDQTELTFDAVQNVRSVKRLSAGGLTDYVELSPGVTSAIEFGSLVDRVNIGIASNITQVYFTCPIYLNRAADASASITSAGQIWVSNTDNLPYYRYEGGDDLPLTGGGGSIQVKEWTYDSTITSGDPGQGMFRFNAGAPGSVSQFWIDDLDDDGQDIGNYAQPYLETGHIIRFQNVDDPADYYEFALENTGTDITGWWSFLVNQVAGGTTFPANGTKFFIEWSFRPRVDVGTINGNVRAMLGWNGNTDEWEATIPTVFGINPANPPVGGRIYSVGSATAGSDRPQWRHVVGNSQSTMHNHDVGPSTDYFYDRLDGNTSPDPERWYFGAYDGVASHDIASFTLDDEFRIENDGTLLLADRAAARTSITGYGEIWVNSATDNLTYTDQTGTGFILNGAGGTLPASSVTGSLLIGDGSTGWEEETDVFIEQNFGNPRMVLDNPTDTISTLDDLTVPFAIGNRAISGTYTGFSHQAIQAQAAGAGVSFGINLYGGTVQLGIGSSPAATDNILLQGYETRIGTTGQGVLRIREMANAVYDIAAYGQIWVQTATPNRLMFTDDAGNDFQISDPGATNQTIASGVTWASSSGSTYSAQSGSVFSAESGSEFRIGESAAGPTATAAYGYLWVEDDAPNRLKFRDDAGTDWPVQSVHEAEYAYDSTTTAADPGTATVRFDSVTIGSIANMYIDDLALSEDWGWILSNLADGDVLVIKSAIDAADYIIASVNGTPTDNTGWWTVPLTLIHTGTIFTNGDPVRIEIQWFSQAGAGGTIGGSITDNQVAVGAATADDIEGSASLTWDGSTLLVTGTVAANNADGPSLVNETPSSVNPTLLPRRSDLNSGIGSAVADTVSIIAGGIEFVRFNESTNNTCDFYVPIFLEEQALANPDVSGWGQIWVESTTSPANRMGFTDDTGEDSYYGAFGIEFNENATRPYGSPGAGKGMLWIKNTNPCELLYQSDIDQTFALINVTNDFLYQFSTTTTAADPGQGFIRWNNATPASVTAIYVDDLDVGGLGHDNRWGDLRRGDIIEIFAQQNNARYGRFAVDGAVTDNTGWWTINVTPIDVGTLPTNNEPIHVCFHRGAIGQTLQDYSIEDPGEYTPTGTTQTLTYSDGPAFQVDLESVTGNITITLSGGPPTGTYGQITIKVTQDSAVARTITWAGGTFRWPGGTAHPMNSTLNGFSIYTFETWDGGTTWWGAGADYS